MVRNPGSTSLGAESVKTTSIEKEAVTPPKVLPATTPTGSATENTVVLGTAGVARKFVGAITGAGVGTTAFKIKHGLETRTFVATILTETFEEPVTMLAKVVSISLSEVEVTYTTGPAAKAINYVVIVG